MDRRILPLIGVLIAVFLAYGASAEPIIWAPSGGSWLANNITTLSFELSESYDNCSVRMDGAAEEVPAVYVENSSGSIIGPGNLSIERELGEGQHNWSVSCWLNGSGVESPSSSFFVDMTAPSVILLLPESLDNLTSRNLSLTLAANDSLDPSPMCEAKLCGDSWPANCTYWNFTGTDERNVSLRFGNHLLEVGCSDLAGNIAYLNKSFEVSPNDVSFNFSVDKGVYFTGEQVNIISLSPIDTDLKIAIFKNLGATPIDVFSTTISNNRTIFFRTFTETGFYSVVASFDYFGHRENISRNFTVRSNDMGVTASANATNARRNQSIRFEAAVEKNASAVSFWWDLNNDGVYETNGRTAITSFDSLGDKMVHLKADDGYNVINRSVVVHIKAARRASFQILENKTDINLKGVTVAIEDISAETNESGGVALEILDGSYTVRVSKSGYFSLYDNIEVGADLAKTYRLESRNSDKMPPEIFLISPKDGESVNSQKVNAVFRVIDASKFNCTVYYSEYSNWYQAVQIKQEMQNNTETSVQISGAEGDNYWKVECIDSQGNLGVSQKNRFSVGEGSSGGSKSSGSGSDETDTLASLLNNVMDELDESISYFRGISAEEQKVSEALSVMDGIDKAKNDVQLLRRDLSNLQFSTSDVQEQRREIQESATDIQDRTIAKFSIVEKLEYTQYPSESAVEDILNRVIYLKNMSLTDRQKEEMIRQNQLLQNQLIVKNNVWIVDLEYLSGKTESVAVIIKQMSFSGSWDNVTVLEDIPKTVAQSAGELEFLTPFSVIDPDPLIKVQPDSQNRTVYYVKGRISSNMIKDTNTIVMLNKVVEAPRSGITGMVAMVGDGASPPMTLFIFLALVALVVIYNSRLMDSTRSKVHQMVDGIMPSKELSGARELISLASQRVNEGNLKEAKRMYKELEIVYKRLPSKQKKEIYPEINLLREEFDAWEISNALKEGRTYLISRDLVMANEVYQKVNRIYNQLSPSKKEEIYPDIKEFIGLMGSMVKR